MMQNEAQWIVVFGRPMSSEERVSFGVRVGTIFQEYPCRNPVYCSPLSLVIKNVRTLPFGYIIEIKKNSEGEYSLRVHRGLQGLMLLDMAL